MPAYLVHGFRWPRAGFTGIRVHAIVHDLEDCSVEYIQNTASQQAILSSFRKAFPELMNALERPSSSGGHHTLEFIEQYDPLDESGEDAVSQPHAFVADKVVELGSGGPVKETEEKGTEAKKSGAPLSVNVEDTIAQGPGLTPQAWEALAELRDKIAADEKIGWWVVYNGDPERAYDGSSASASDDDAYDEDYDDNDNDQNELARRTTPTQSSMSATGTPAKDTARPHPQQYGPPVPPKSPTTPGSSTHTGKTAALPLRDRPAAATNQELGPMVLPPPPPPPTTARGEDQVIPEPAKAREVAKASGFRKKFFGKKT